MSESVKSASISVGMANIIRNNKIPALELPHPSELWTRWSVSDAVAKRRRKLQANHIIYVVENHRQSEDECNVYRTNPQAYNWIQANVNRPKTLPCGHSGIRNLRDGGYTCYDDDCQAEFDRAAAEEVLRG